MMRKGMIMEKTEFSSIVKNALLTQSSLENGSLGAIKNTFPVHPFSKLHLGTIRTNNKDKVSILLKQGLWKFQT